MKKNKKKLDEKRVSILSLLVVIIIMITGIVLTPIMIDGINPNTAIFEGSTNKISISNKLPLSDEGAKNLDPKKVENPDVLNSVDFKVKGLGKENMAVTYNIYLIDTSPSDSIRRDYVKVYLANGDGTGISYYSGRVVPSYADLKVYTKNPAGKIIYSGKIKGGEEQDFTLKIWLADNYALTNDVKYFKGRIQVEVIGGNYGEGV